jgi:hypothetical protein
MELDLCNCANTNKNEFINGVRNVKGALSCIPPVASVDKSDIYVSR